MRFFGREDLQAYGEKPLVEDMFELDPNRDDDAEESEVEVDISAVQKYLITLGETHSESEV